MKLKPQAHLNNNKKDKIMKNVNELLFKQSN